MEKKTLIVADYTEIEQLIQEHFGHPFELPCCEEIGPRASQTYDIDGKLNDYDQKTVHKFLTTGDYGSWTTGIYMNYLCSLGVLEPGEYLVEIDW